MKLASTGCAVQRARDLKSLRKAPGVPVFVGASAKRLMQRYCSLLCAIEGFGFCRGESELCVDVLNRMCSSFDPTCLATPFHAAFAFIHRDSLVGYQASARGGKVRVKIVQEEENVRVLLQGQAVTVFRGLFRRPAMTTNL